jgi:hypothetical protein
MSIEEDIEELVRRGLLDHCSTYKPKVVDQNPKRCPSSKYPQPIQLSMLLEER